MLFAHHCLKGKDTKLGKISRYQTYPLCFPYCLNQPVATPIQWQQYAHNADAAVHLRMQLHSNCYVRVHCNAMYVCTCAHTQEVCLQTSFQSTEIYDLVCLSNLSDKPRFLLETVSLHIKHRLPCNRG